VKCRLASKKRAMANSLKVNRRGCVMSKRQFVFYLGMIFLLFPVVVQATVDVEDISPPQIASASITPLIVNTSDASATLTLTLHITDDLSGTQQAFYRFEPANPLVDGQLVDAGISDFNILDVCTGVSTDLLCNIPFTIPRYAAGGEWVPVWILTTDTVGNRFSISGEAITMQMPGYVTFLNDTEGGAGQSQYVYMPIVTR
jgi:hypothetical protein